MVTPLWGHQPIDFLPDLLVAGVFIVLSTIFIGLAAKFLVLRFVLGMPSGRAIFADLVMNAASTMLTSVPLAGLEFMSDGTVDVALAGWPIVCATVLFGATLIEWLIVRFGFGVPRERRPLGWLFVGNLPSITVACICLVVPQPPVRCGPKHVYQLEEAPEFLTEELAIEKARITLAKDGYRPEEWQLTRADSPPSKAPDGRADKYFDRFSFRPTEGRVYFTDGKRYHTVQVQLEGSRVICFWYRGL
jgi:hypothetical protein